MFVHSPLASLLGRIWTPRLLWPPFASSVFGFWVWNWWGLLPSFSSATIMSEYANKKTRGAFIAAVFAMQGFGFFFMTVFMFALAIPYHHWTMEGNQIGFVCCVVFVSPSSLPILVPMTPRLWCRQRFFQQG